VHYFFNYDRRVSSKLVILNITGVFSIRDLYFSEITIDRNWTAFPHFSLSLWYQPFWCLEGGGWTPLDPRDREYRLPVMHQRPPRLAGRNSRAFSRDFLRDTRFYHYTACMKQDENLDQRLLDAGGLVLLYICT